MFLVHDSPLSGHMGQATTWERARRAAWWPGMKTDVMKYVQGCDKCQLHKQKKFPGRAPLRNTDIPGRPLDKVQIDFCSPFHKSIPDEMEYILAIQDVFSRYCILIPTRDCKAETAAQVFRERWVCQFGIPLMVQSDRGTHFTALVFQETCKALGIKHISSSANHPQSQGQVEHQNHLVDNIRCVIEEEPYAWPRAVEVVQFAHNTAVNATTGYTPHDLLFGQASRRPETLLARQLSLSGRLSDEDWENDETHKEMARRQVENGQNI